MSGFYDQIISFLEPNQRLGYYLTPCVIYIYTVVKKLGHPMKYMDINLLSNTIYRYFICVTEPKTMKSDLSYWRKKLGHTVP